MSNAVRLSGLATGMDTDSTVKQLMKPYQLKLDKLNQNKQLVQWKQDLYRDILGDINSLKRTYFDLLKPESNVLSRGTYAGFDSAVTNAVTGNTSSAVTITTNADAIAGNYKIVTTSLAKATSVSSTARVQTTVPADAVTSTKLSDIGITSTSIKITYNNGSGADQTADIVIDPTTMTLGDLAYKINTATSNGVAAKFSELTGKFSIQSAGTGSNTKVVIADTSAANILDKLNLSAAGATVAGTDLVAEITAPGEIASTTITKATNAFTIDGINYRFNSDANVNVNVSNNVQKPYDKIKAFIDKYNDLIDKIGDKIGEKAAKGYAPLTDEQKKSMSEEQITTWETKAKQGLIRNDSMFSSMLTEMRSAFFQPVSGTSLTMPEIGINTSSDISERGKIIIDETKLKNALQNNGEAVANLFAKVSTTKPTYDPDYSVADRGTRSSEQGVFQRISDILLDYTRTTRNDAGKKGYLIEKAGIKGDYSEYNNILTKDLRDKQTAIDDMLVKMSDKENRYYSQFAKMETAMNKLNSQSSWLSQQLGSTSS